jgi:hypothetical protein
MHLCWRNLVGVTCLALFGLGVLVPAGHAAEHLMQIEQAIGGVEGNTAAQAIQLRMRFAGQNVVGITRVVALDANGANPVVVCDLTATVPNSAVGSRILLTTAAFNALTDIPTVPDFTMASPIPASYLAAGSITFQNDAGTILYWRLSWGGGSYVGPCAGLLTGNFPDGNNCPPMAGALPSGDLRSALFPGAAGAGGTTSLADYVITDSASVWTNNAGNFFVLVPEDTSTTVDPGWDLDAPIIIQAPFAPNPFSESTRMAFRLNNESLATLLITDVSGRQIARREERLPAGAHEFSWDGRNVNGSPVSAGRYFYRLNAAGASRSGDLILVR